MIAIIWVPLAWFLGQWLVVEKPLEKADAIFVLAGSANYVERNAEAARLYNLGIAPKILLTDDRNKGGWDNERQRNPYFVERAKWLLLENGVPETSIVILPDRINGTDDEAKALAKHLQQNPYRSVLLVTSSFHTRRALWTFTLMVDDMNLNTEIGVHSSPATNGPHSSAFWWTNRNGLRTTISEYLKLIYYYFALSNSNKL
ncbi:MAG: YdcF family protein [Acidobacteria bacterium]|nr:YdcF family protein [Acidobacteriota bacterium]